MMEMVVTTRAIGRAKLQSNHHHQQTNTQFLQAECLPVAQPNSVKALKGNVGYMSISKYLVTDECTM